MGSVVFREGIPDWSRTLGLAFVDLVLVLAFVVTGEVRHGVDPLAQLGRVLATTLPFTVGWLVAATAAGLYSLRVSPREAILRAGGAWLVAAVTGVGLRATPLAPGNFAPAFLLVSVLVGGFLLVPWRALVAILEARGVVV